MSWFEIKVRTLGIFAFPIQSHSIFTIRFFQIFETKNVQLWNLKKSHYNWFYQEIPTTKYNVNRLANQKYKANWKYKIDSTLMKPQILVLNSPHFICPFLFPPALLNPHPIEPNWVQPQIYLYFRHNLSPT